MTGMMSNGGGAWEKSMCLDRGSLCSHGNRDWVVLAGGYTQVERTE